MMTQIGCCVISKTEMYLVLSRVLNTKKKILSGLELPDIFFNAWV